MYLKKVKATKICFTYKGSSCSSRPLLIFLFIFSALRFYLHKNAYTEDFWQCLSIVPYYCKICCTIITEILSYFYTLHLHVHLHNNTILHHFPFPISNSKFIAFPEFLWDLPITFWVYVLVAGIYYITLMFLLLWLFLWLN